MHRRVAAVRQLLLVPLFIVTLPTQRFAGRKGFSRHGCHHGRMSMIWSSTTLLKEATANSTVCCTLYIDQYHIPIVRSLRKLQTSYICWLASLARVSNTRCADGQARAPKTFFGTTDTDHLNRSFILPFFQSSQAASRATNGSRFWNLLWNCLTNELDCCDERATILP